MIAKSVTTAEATNQPAVLSRVLIVEDDNPLAEVMSEVLTFENYIPDIAANGMEALESLRVADYEAIICDLMMPRLDGESLYNEVVKDYPYLAEKFLFITGQASYKAGLTDFIAGTGNTLLEKPFDVDQLRAALQELLTR